MAEETKTPTLYPLPTTAELSIYSDEVQDIWYMLSEILDPEFPYTLAELRVIRPEHIVSDEISVAVVFTPTVPHCGLSTLIGLALREQLRRNFGETRKISVAVRAHDEAAKLNKQLKDKERVLAAMENPEIADVINKMIGSFS